MENYNIHLYQLRINHHLSLKELSKKTGISKWLLYFYENGYFRPSKKSLKILQDFFKEDISIKGIDAYPMPLKIKPKKEKKDRVKFKRIFFGSFAAFALTLAIIGANLFSQSVHNKGSYYGETYNVLRDKVRQNGAFGYDMVTSLKYHYVDEADNKASRIIFYETDNILYFNECTYSVSVHETNYGMCRFHYSFESNLAVSSNVCDFTFGSISKGTFFTCKFSYQYALVNEFLEFSNVVEGSQHINQKEALRLVNAHLHEAEVHLSNLMTQTAGYNISFYNDFLPAREKGRNINFILQIVGISLIFPNIFAFFIFLALFLRALLRNIKPRLVLTNIEKHGLERKDLPEDLQINFGIPDLIVAILGRVLQIGSVIILLAAYVGKLGVPVLSALANPTLLDLFRYLFLSGIFIDHFITIGRIKRSRLLFETIIQDLFLFLFIATIETVLITLTNSWGYDFANLIFKYVPSNVYQVVAIHYLIFLFLFFEPKFLDITKRSLSIMWHSLSIIPLAMLVIIYHIGNSYALIYGVEENIFISFWFPNGFLPLSIVSVIFFYTMFFSRIIFKTRYGRKNAEIFFYGDRFTLIENTLWAFLILVVTIIDLSLRGNQYAYYLGLGNNFWLFALIPIILLTKYSPNNQQTLLLMDTVDLPTRN